MRALIVTDGANYQKAAVKHAGSAAVIALYKPASIELHRFGCYVGTGSNNYAELRAIEFGLVQAKLLQATEIKLVSDSMYCCGMFKRRNGRWHWNAQANMELIASVREKIMHFNLWQVHWVRGHTGDRLNEMADEIATICKTSQKDVCYPVTYEGDSSSLLRGIYGVYKNGLQARYNRAEDVNDAGRLWPSEVTI